MAKNNKSQNTEKHTDDVIVADPNKVVETPVTEGNETPVASDETPVVTGVGPVTETTGPVITDENPVVNPDDKPVDIPKTDGTETLVVNPDDSTVVNPDNKSDDEAPKTDGTETPEQPVINPDDAAKPEDTDADKKETKLNLFRRFDIRYASSVDKGVYVTRKNWSTSDLVNTFVKMPTSFIAFETKEDLEEFKKIIAVKEINVLDKDGKKVPFSKPAKEHLVSRLSELSDMWISKKLK